MKKLKTILTAIYVYVIFPIFCMLALGGFLYFAQRIAGDLLY